MQLFVYSSPLGRIIIGAEEESIVGLWLEGQQNVPTDAVYSVKPTAIANRAFAWLDAYFAGQKPDPNTLPLAPRGSTYQQLVWQKLLEIPYGKTVTYGQLAVKIANRMGVARMSPQAIGGAVSRNPISIIIPCHRVIGAGGKLTGYAGGLDKKLWLLHHEGLADLEIGGSAAV